MTILKKSYDRPRTCAILRNSLDLAYENFSTYFYNKKPQNLWDFVIRNPNLSLQQTQYHGIIGFSCSRSAPAKWCCLR
jgi:hypothetical protein